MPDNRVTAQPVTVDGERRVQVSVGLVWAVLTPAEARVLVKQLELSLKWKDPG